MMQTATPLTADGTRRSQEQQRAWLVGCFLRSSAKLPAGRCEIFGVAGQQVSN